MTIQEKINEEIKTALKAKDSLKLSVLRGLSAAFTNELVSLGQKPSEDLSDDLALKVIKKAAKQRSEAIRQFEAGDRPDLAEKEAAELEIIKKYLPQELSPEEIKKVIEAKKTELGITDKSQLGQLIGATMKEIGSQADGAMVKKLAEETL